MSTLIEELLKRLSQDGLTFTVVNLSDLLGGTKDGPLSEAAEASKLLDWIIRNEAVVRGMHGLLDKHGQSEKAEKLKAWWTELCKPLQDLHDEIPGDHSDPEMDSMMVKKIKATAEPVVECGRGVLTAIMERQTKAVAEVDFDDLIS